MARRLVCRRKQPICFPASYCEHQAYSMGKHLAFQCHVEMTEDMVKVWCDTGKVEVMASLSSPAVQHPQKQYKKG
jgi:GMP synthase-like glutamine amidotransferase